MSKVIVIERCGDCPYMKWTGETTACLKTGMDIDPLSPDFDKYEAGAGMPDWCPLRPLPEYVNPEPMAAYNTIMYAVDHTPQWEKGMAEGWNACLDAITGEGEE